MAIACFWLIHIKEIGRESLPSLPPYTQEIGAVTGIVREWKRLSHGFLKSCDCVEWLSVGVIGASTAVVAYIFLMLIRGG